MGTDGSVAYLFNQRGVISFASGTDEEAVLEIALEAGADDVVVGDDGAIEVLTSQADYMAVKDALDVSHLKMLSAELTMHPETTVSLDADSASKALAMIDALEDLDDVQHVYCNADVSDEVLAHISADR